MNENGLPVNKIDQETNVDIEKKVSIYRKNNLG